VSGTARRFTYEILLRVEIVEDHVDMPSLNVNTLGEELARQAENLAGGKANLVAAHLTKNERVKRTPKFAPHVETFLDDLIGGGTTNMVDDR